MQSETKKMPVAVAIAKIDRADLNQLLLYSFMALAICIMLTDSAYAISTPMGSVLCRVVDFVLGNLGRGLATLAVAIVGIGAMLGKVSWGLAATVGVGIAVLFGCSTIAGYLVGAAGGVWVACP